MEQKLDKIIELLEKIEKNTRVEVSGSGGAISPKYLPESYGNSPLYGRASYSPPHYHQSALGSEIACVDPLCTFFN